MSAGLLIRMRPEGPWRFGPATGARDRVDTHLHSDSLYAAVCHAFERLGSLDEWLLETAQAHEPAAVFTSLYPSVRDHLFVAPPRSVWPPAPSPKRRWKGAQYVPLSLIPLLLTERPLKDDAWIVDVESGCLLPVEKNNLAVAPFRIARRSAAAVDRIAGNSSFASSTACLEFSEQGGLWCWVRFRDVGAGDRWSGRLQAAFRLLADTGLGGERSSGWGRTASLTFEDRDDLFSDASGAEPFWWLLSVYNPADRDAVDWTRGSYHVITRSGRTTRMGASTRQVRMVAEGSVIATHQRPVGRLLDVRPDGTEQPVLRCGAAVAVRIAGVNLGPPGTRTYVEEAPAPVPIVRAETPAPEPAVEPEPSATEPVEPEPPAAEPPVEPEQVPTAETPVGFEQPVVTPEEIEPSAEQISESSVVGFGEEPAARGEEPPAERESDSSNPVGFEEAESRGGEEDKSEI